MICTDAALMERPSTTESTEHTCGCGQVLDVWTHEHCPRCGCQV
ncbi:MAG: hypothetical protein JWR35_1333 [Marmoricola sp.]|jgi:hypothetical protein|nr:hypothetical protein [Marmoricola sp.]